MRKGWLFAAAAAGFAGGFAGNSQAADVQLFGIHTPGENKWAVYALINNPNSVVAGQQVSGLSSIAVDVQNSSFNTGTGDPFTGTATVGSAANKLPSGSTNATDPSLFTGNVGYGFWLVRSDGTADANGISGISGGQYAIFQDPPPAGAPNYKKFVLSGVGLTAGTQGTDADITSTTKWTRPVLVAQGAYTHTGDTRAGLKINFSGDTGVNLLRDTDPSANVKWTIEGAVGKTVVDAKSFTTGSPVAGITTTKAGEGDANLDGTVGFGDLVALAQNYGGNNTNWFQGDFNYDGVTDFGDLVLLAQHYGQPVPADPAFGAAFNADLAKAFAAVPEPGTLGLVAGLVAFGLGRRRRK
jgi:hypothetical protein